MTPGIVVGIGVVLLLAVAGRSIAGAIDAGRPPVALGAVVSLATLLVLVTDISAVWRFDARVGYVVWAMLVIVPVLAHRRYPWLGMRLSPPEGALVVAAVALAVPMMLLPVPLDTDAQGFGHLSLAIRDGGTLNTLAPWRPGIAYLYSPGALLLNALVSSLLPRIDMAAVMMGVGHASVFLFVWLAGELGTQLALAAGGSDPAEVSAARADAWTRIARVSALASAGLWTALLDSHYTAMVAIVLLLGFVTAMLRSTRTGSRRDLCVAGVLLAAIPIAHADTAIIATLGGASFIVAGLVDRRTTGAPDLAWHSVAAGAVALVVAAPWLITLRGLIGAGVESPYGVTLSNWRALLLFNGVVWPLAAIPGYVVARRLKQAWALPMAIWMLLLIEFGVTGLLQRVAPALMNPLVRFNYPFSIAWHGPIVPCLALAIPAIAALRIGNVRTPRWAPAVALAVMLAPVVASREIQALSHRFLRAYGAFSTANDVEAMRWIRDHTRSDARVLNYPGDYDHRRDWEAHWAPVITERDCVYFRMQLFFAPRSDIAPHTDAVAAAYQEQQELVSFWRDPADASNLERLRAAHIAFVLVPESVGDPSSLARSWRWQPPVLVSSTRSTPADARYLRLVHAAGGAHVYEVTDSAGQS